MDGTVVDRVAALAELERIEADVFAAPASGGGGRMYGGEAACRALVAARETVPDELVPHVAHAVYLRPGDPALPCRIVVDRVRDGRSFATRRVDVEQRGKAILTATLSFHRGAAAFEHQDRMPVVPPPEELDAIGSWTDTQPFWPAWALTDATVELRPVPDLSGLTEGRRMLWYRVPGVERLPERAAASLWFYASDLSAVHSIRLPHEDAASPNKAWLMTTLNHTVWFHRPVLLDSWHLLVQWSSQASDGRGIAHGQLFSRSGELVSTLVQEGLATGWT